MTSPYLFGSLFSKFRDLGSELDTCPNIFLCLAGLCDSAKLELGVRTNLIWQYCGDVNGLTVVTFTEGRASNMRVDLYTIEGMVHAKVTKDLLCSVYDNGVEDKVLSRVTHLSGRETFSTVFLWHPDLWSTLETIMAILLKLVWKFLGRHLLIFFSIFGLYIRKITNPNLIKFDLVDDVYILCTLDNIDNISKKRPIEKAIVSVKIRKFPESIYQPFIHLSFFIYIESINQKGVYLFFVRLLAIWVKVRLTWLHLHFWTYNNICRSVYMLLPLCISNLS